MEVSRVSPDLPCQTRSMLRLLWLLFVLAARSVRFRRALLLEILALRQQLAALKRRHPQPRFRVADKLFWVMLRRLWPGWKRALVLVQPAGDLGLTNAALHYHFPSKSELGEALIARYAIRFAGALVEIDESLADPLRKLDAYADLYADVLQSHRMCLCGMLAAEYETLSAGMQDAVAFFFEKNEKWLAGG